ncbi:unnamed protein product [Meganyctiphanes norvegica]|uniref:Maturase K n=1 Tax=Meganyctiphanes norvegica TaxID=48144 RepID=A0AAV2RQL4_MEGNR
MPCICIYQFDYLLHYLQYSTLSKQGNTHILKHLLSLWDSYNYLAGYLDQLKISSSLYIIYFFLPASSRVMQRKCGTDMSGKDKSLLFFRILHLIKLNFRIITRGQYRGLLPVHQSIKNAFFGNVADLCL